MSCTGKAASIDTAIGQLMVPVVGKFDGTQLSLCFTLMRRRVPAAKS